VQAFETLGTYAIVAIDEGVRVPTIIVERAPEDLRVDRLVATAFHDVSAAWSPVRFRPRERPWWLAPSL